MRNLIILFLTVSFFSCSQNKTPKGILPPDKMQAVLWDYMRADVFTTDYISKDSFKNLPAENIKLQKEIFNIYHITKEEFYNSYNYYLKHNKEMSVMLDSLVAKKNRERANLIKK